MPCVVGSVPLHRVVTDEIRRRVGVHTLATSARGARHNLPAELNSFVGREQELVEVERLLGRTRLVTLVGTGESARRELRS